MNEENNSPEDPGPSADRLPDHLDCIVLADGQTDGGTQHKGQKLYRVSIDPGAAECTIAAEYETTSDVSVTGVVSIEEGYVVTLQDGERTRIAIVDSSFEEVVVRDFSNAHVVTAADGIVYAAHKNGIRTLDKRLETIGTGGLQGEVRGKHMEDIQVYDGIAYVVDDIVFPLFLLRFDVSDPRAPTFIDSIPIREVNQTLQQQWLHPSKNQWGVIQETNHMGGGSQAVYIFNLAVQDRTPKTESRGELEPDDVPAFQFAEAVCLYSITDSDARSVYDKDADGVAIQDVTREPPMYATVTTNGTNYLSSMTVTADAPEGDRVAFDHTVELDESARVTTLNGHVLVVTINRQVYLFDPESESVVTRCDVDIADPLEVF